MQLLQGLIHNSARRRVYFRDSANRGVISCRTV